MYGRAIYYANNPRSESSARWASRFDRAVEWTLCGVIGSLVTSLFILI